MKTQTEIINILNIKLKEHTDIIDQISDDLKNLRKDGSLENAHKHMILKDKILFHRSAILTLNDVLKEIT